MEIKKVEKDFGFARNLDYFKESFILMLKRAVEYKVNFYSTLSIEFLYFFAIFIFFGVFISNFGNIIPWSKADFFIYAFFTSLISAFSGLFLWKWSLFEYASKGVLNSFLTKPIKTWFFSYVLKWVHLQLLL